MLASGGVGKTIRLWEMATRETRATLKGANTILSLAFSPDGKKLAAVEAVTGKRPPDVNPPGAIQIWDVASGAEPPKLGRYAGKFTSVVFSLDGKTLVSGGWDATIRLWDVATGKNIATVQPTGAVLCLALSPDGKTVAAGGTNKYVTLWDFLPGAWHAP